MWRNQKIKRKPIAELNLISKALQDKAGELEKEIEAEKLKVGRARENGNPKDARVYAENANRKHGERSNYIHLSLRLDEAIDTLTFPITRAAAESMGSTIKSLESSLAAGDLQKLTETMDQLERQFASRTEPPPDDGNFKISCRKERAIPSWEETVLFTKGPLEQRIGAWVDETAVMDTGFASVTETHALGLHNRGSRSGGASVTMTPALSLYSLGVQSVTVPLALRLDKTM